MGKDAMTTGTLSIICLFVLYIMYSIKNKKIIYDKIDVIAYLFVIVGGGSLLIMLVSGTLPEQMIGREIRKYFHFFTSVFIFIIIKNYYYIEDEINVYKLIQNLIGLILILLSIHICISMLVKYMPGFNQYLLIFSGRQKELLEFSSGGFEEISRISSFVFSPEGYAEIIAGIISILIYKLLDSKKVIWGGVFFVLFIGLIFTVTRSGIILFTFSFLAMTFYLMKKRTKALFLYSYAFILIFVPITILNPGLFADVVERFSVTANVYVQGGTTLEIINRDSVFMPAITNIKENINLFGNGISDFNFHNLFMTYLYEEGIIGFMFMSFFIILIFVYLFCALKQVQNESLKALLFACLLSMSIFFVNEMKYEFNRNASYQQIWWSLFGIYMLLSMYAMNKKFI